MKLSATGDVACSGNAAACAAVASAACCCLAATLSRPIAADHVSAGARHARDGGSRPTTSKWRPASAC